MWPYHNSDGEPVGVIVRWDTPTEKDIRAASFDAARGGWVLAGMSQPRPLYRLPELTDAGRIFVTEGEKAADAARALGLGATTSPHGSNGATKTDWSPLAGKQVVILPDHDKAGENYAEM
jgi:putative DNA primase/helicase